MSLRLAPLFLATVLAFASTGTAQPFYHTYNVDIRDSGGLLHPAQPQDVFMQLPGNATGRPVLLLFPGQGYQEDWCHTTGGCGNLNAALLSLMTEAATGRNWIVVSFQPYGQWGGVVGGVAASYGNPEMDQRITGVLQQLQKGPPLRFGPGFEMQRF